MNRTEMALAILGLSLLLDSVLWAAILLIEGLFGTEAWIVISASSTWSGPILVLTFASIGLLVLAPPIFLYGRHDFPENHPRFVSFGVVLIYVTLFASQPVAYYFPSWIYSLISPLLMGFGILLLVWTPATKTSRALLIAGALTMPIYIGYGILCFPVLATFLSLRRTELKRVAQRQKEMEDWLTHVDSEPPDKPDERR